MSDQRSDWRERLHANPSRMEQELGNLTTEMNNFPRILVSSIIDSLSEIDIIEDYSSRSNINLVQDPIRANAVFPEALKASLEPQTQVGVRGSREALRASGKTALARIG